MNSYIEKDEVKLFIEGDYVREFNTALQPFKKQMRAFHSPKGYFLVWSPTRTREVAGREVRMRYNLFWGSEKILFQFKKGGSSSGRNIFGSIGLLNTVSVVIGKQSAEVNFGKMSELYAEITDAGKGQQVMKSALFVPVYPRRRVRFHFTKNFEQVYVDRYRDNLVPGETRLFAGKPRQMKQKNIMKIVSCDCDVPHIYKLETGESYEMKKDSIRIPYCETENLGIDKSIDGVPYFDKGLNYPLPWPLGDP